MDNELIKSRNVSKCVSAAFKLFNSNINRIATALWLPILVYSLVASAFLTVSFFALGYKVQTAATPWIVYGMMIVLAAAYVWFLATLFNLLNAQGMKCNLVKIVKLVLVYIALTIVFGIFIAAAVFVPNLMGDGVDRSHVLVVVIGVVSVIILFFLVLMLPFSYAFMAYMMEEGSFRKTFFPAYKVGFRHWGFLFVVMFVVGLISIVVSCVLTMPLIILNIVQMLSYRGLAWGDPSGLPSYFPWFFFMTSTILYVLVSIFSVWIYMVIYYAYGSIKRNEIDRNNKKNIQEQ